MSLIPCLKKPIEANNSHPNLNIEIFFLMAIDSCNTNASCRFKLKG